MARAKLAAPMLVLLIPVGCAVNTPPKYDTHETYDSKVEQYGIDYNEWLTNRRTRYRIWKDEIYDPAVQSVSAQQWDQYNVNVERECGRKAGRYQNDSEFGQCRERLFNRLLVENFSAFEALEAYIERQGGEDPKPERPKYKLKPSPPSKYDIEYEEAKQACGLAKGQWITVLHADDRDWFANWMRCLVEQPPVHDPAWDDSLLPYEIYVKYDRRSKVIIEFDRIPKDSP